MAEKILVLGVGNILYTDEGTGVKTMRWLEANYRFPDNVTLMDGGTLAIGLMSALMDCDLVLVLDAVLGGDEPGSIYRMTGEDLRKSLGFRESVHQMDLVDTLLFCELAGHRPDAVVLGMEPVDYKTMAVDLSPLIEERLPLLAGLLLEELEKRGVKAEKIG